jgi:4-hydroxy-2-oxoheptanedioate aldolase
MTATSRRIDVPRGLMTDGSHIHAKVPLDLGAMGICFPMTTRRLDAESAVKAVRYPPLGDRHWGPFYAPLRWNLGYSRP